MEPISPEHSLSNGLSIVSYAESGGGLVSGAFWQPVNIVNQQAWHEIEQHIEASRRKVAAGRVSCLHYYMIANQMDAALLGRYTGLPGWLVRLHLLPFIFRRLGRETLTRYAQVFLVSPDDLSAGRLLPPVYNQQAQEVQTC